MSGLVRVIIHWTGGPWRATVLDKEHYHFIVEGTGTVVPGNLPPEENISTNDGIYGAHTYHLNTGSIGVSMAAMAGAQPSPLHWGDYPLTVAQLAACYRLVADLCRKYGIKITRETVLTHAEVQPTLKIQQKGKWDIRCLPGDRSIRDAVAVGDEIRAAIARLLK